MNSSNSVASGNPISKDFAEQQSDYFEFYRGIPRPEWDYMVRDGFLNGKDVLLLKVINTLTTQKEWCYATNRYLGESTGRQPNRISDTLQEMVKKNLITIKYGKRDGEDCRWIRLNTEGTSTYRPYPKEGPPPTQKRVGPLPKNREQKEEEVNEEEKEEQHSRQRGSSVAAAPSKHRCDKVDGSPSFGINKPKNILDQKIYDLAVKLKQALKDKKKLRRSADLVKWAREFKKLSEDDEVGLATLEKVVLWYLPHIGEDKIPEAYSASGIVEKWEKLVGAYERFNNPQTSKSSNKIPVSVDSLSEEEEWVYDKVKDLYWPKGSKLQLPSAIRQSYAAYSTFKQSLCDYLTNHEEFSNGKFNHLWQVCEQVDAHTFEPKDYLEQWFTRNNEVAHWDKWCGHLSIFSLDHKWFKTELYEHCENFSGDPEDADLLLKELGLVKEDAQ
jgi:hypothetical protein